MTVVACKVTDDGISISADSLAVMGWTQEKNFIKLKKINDIIFGGAGYSEDNTLMEIFCSTHQPKDSTKDSFLVFLSEFSKWKKDRIDDREIYNSYIFIYRGVALVTQQYDVRVINDCYAIGSGRDFALSAMYLGKNTESAVNVACELSIYCEEPITSFYVDLKGEV